MTHTVNTYITSHPCRLDPYSLYAIMEVSRKPKHHNTFTDFTKYTFRVCFPLIIKMTHDHFFCGLPRTGDPNDSRIPPVVAIEKINNQFTLIFLQTEGTSTRWKLFHRIEGGKSSRHYEGAEKWVQRASLPSIIHHALASTGWGQHCRMSTLYREVGQGKQHPQC